MLFSSHSQIPQSTLPYLRLSLHALDYSSQVHRELILKEWERYRDSLQIARIISGSFFALLVNVALCSSNQLHLPHSPSSLMIETEVRRINQQLDKLIEAHKLVTQALHDPVFIPVLELSPPSARKDASLDGRFGAPGSKSSSSCATAAAAMSDEEAVEREAELIGVRAALESALKGQVEQSRTSTLAKVRHERFLADRFRSLRAATKQQQKQAGGGAGEPTVVVPLLEDASAAADGAASHANGLSGSISSSSSAAAGSGAAALASARVDHVSECPICQDRLSEPMLTWCGHIYCSQCIMKWVRASGHCPQCRQVLQISNKHLFPIAKGGMERAAAAEKSLVAAASLGTQQLTSPASPLRLHNSSDVAQLGHGQDGVGGAAAARTGPLGYGLSMPHPQGLIESQGMEGASDYGSKIEAIVKVRLMCSLSLSLLHRVSPLNQSIDFHSRPARYSAVPCAPGSF